MISQSELHAWLSKENLATKSTRVLHGFEITDSIDGNKDPQKEISLVKIKEAGQYPEHIHKKSDTFFIIIEGSGLLLQNKEKKLVKSGDAIEIPRGTPHGFEIQNNQPLTFISIQSPPIRNTNTGEEDFHLITQI